MKNVNGGRRSSENHERRQALGRSGGSHTGWAVGRSSEDRRSAVCGSGQNAETGRSDGTCSALRENKLERTCGRGSRGACAKLGAAKAQRVEFLYEDREIIAVNKPCGLSVISSGNSRAKTLYDIVTMHIQRRNPRGRAAVVHRLDRDTSGVMIFAKDARTKKAMMSAWNELVKDRKYIALVEGHLESSEGVFDSYLLEESAYKVRLVPKGTAGALRAITRYCVLKEARGCSLLELTLETGRRHQIRVQLAASGCPIVGDERYGSRKNLLGRLGLHASVIEFVHPWKNEIVRVSSSIPSEFERAIS